MGSLAAKLEAGAKRGPRNLNAKGRREWESEIPLLAKGDGAYGGHGAITIAARHFKSEYGLTCCLRSVQNALAEDLAKWRAEHGK